MGGYGNPTGPLHKFSLPVPEGMLPNFAFSHLGEIDESGSRGTGIEGYRPFLVLQFEKGNGRLLNIQCDPGDEAHLKEFLPIYLSDRLKREKAAWEMDL